MFISRFLLDLRDTTIGKQSETINLSGEHYGNSLGQIEPIWRRLSRQAKS
jgi:hypothetical protein